MNETNSTGSSCCCSGVLKTGAWMAGVLGSFALIGALAYYSVRVDPTPGLDAQREVARYQTRRDLDAAAAAEVQKFAIDGTKENKAQLAVPRAMEILLSEWKDDSAAGRAKLLERLEASKKAASFE